MSGDIQKLIAYKKVLDTCVFMHPIIARFPKNERFVLGQEIEGCLVSAVRRIVRINGYSGKKKEDFIELELDLDMTEHFLAVAKQLNFLSAKQFGAASEKMEEVERVIRGWKRSQLSTV